MSFSKYHGLGNDFLVVDFRDRPDSVYPPQAVRAICERRFGVGADGILAVLPPRSPDSDVRMRVLNADGGEAEMCGNGIRCLVKHLWEREPALRSRGEIAIDTGAGRLTCQVQISGDEVVGVRVDMGPPRLERGEIPMLGPAAERAVKASIEGFEHPITAVSMGNPHAIAFVEGEGELRALAESRGPRLETHPSFPQRTNAEFARVIGPREIELVVWERGCGITLACGTGACATAVAAVLEGRVETGEPITVRLLGGELQIDLAPDLSRVWMTGPATHVYDGELDPGLFG